SMAQSSLVKVGIPAKKSVEVVTKRKIKIPFFDNSVLIQGYSKTVIGRCMNPRKQDLKTLLFMLPRIWQLEGKIAGADLGLGKFQFDFDNEEDIEEVLKMEPFHFDHWMVAMVRWKPSVDPLYPSAITFWIRILGVPLQFWADPTFRSIGEDLGRVHEVEIDTGRVRVTVDGFKPLCFESVLEFESGEEITVKIRYERLFGYCRLCFSMCHDEDYCDTRVSLTSGRGQSDSADDGAARRQHSYRGAVTHERRRGADSEDRPRGSSRGSSRGRDG
ncbi:hypothetical protein CARUB_v10011684mg, partial [Capsella rubella]